MSAISSVVALLHGLLVGGAFAALVALLGIPDPLTGKTVLDH